MAKLTWKMLGRASVLILALVLALGVTAPAFAQDEDGLERRGFSGVVTVLEEGSITVKTEDGESVTVALTEDTGVRLPSVEIEVQSVSDVEFEEGTTRVAILAQVEDDILTALWILVKPERPQVGHLLGTIISIEGNVITIVDAQGNEHTVELPEQALQGLQVGDMTTLVVNQSDGDADGPENPVANAAVTARQIQERVAEHAAIMQQRAQAGDVPVTTAEERIQFLSELMDTIRDHVLGVLTAVLEKVPPQAQAAIADAMERAEAGFGMAQAAIQQAGPPEGIGPPEGLGPSDNTSGNDGAAGGGPPEGLGRPGR